jgi:hypothetical protein
MGNRATILFFDRNQVSPTVYLHWNGSDVPDWLDDLSRRMTGRTNDAAYAAARFVGICHERIPGNLSLGVASNSLTVWDLSDGELLAKLSPGNAGIVVVDTADFAWRAYGGYLVNHAKPTERSDS